MSDSLPGRSAAECLLCVERLLALNSSFLPPVQAAEKMLSELGATTQQSRLALLWQDCWSNRSEILLWRSKVPAERLFSTGPLPNSPDQQPGAAVPQLVGLAWELLSVGDESRPVYIGREPAADSEQIPAILIELLGRLFGISLNFEEQLRTQKLSALAEYAAGAGHEINNPLGSIIGRTSQLLKAETDPEKRRVLETIGAQAYRIGDMIGDTMLFANPPAMKPSSVDLSQVVQSVIETFQAEWAQHQISVLVDCVANVPVFADGIQLRIVIAELLRNALKALREVPVTNGQRTLSVTSGIDVRDGRRGGLLEVVDNGPGLTPYQQEHCFDPFYSGDLAGRGLGFGLSKCWRIVQLHRGEIQLDCSAGITRVRVWLPVELVAE